MPLLGLWVFAHESAVQVEHKGAVNVRRLLVEREVETYVVSDVYIL